MRKLLLLGLFVMGGMMRAEDFIAIMTPEERAALGLQKLTAEELARLEAAVQRYKSGELAVVRREAEQKLAAAEVSARTAQAAGATEERKRSYWALLFGEVDTTQFLVESTLPGEFQIFNGRPIFKLANGQRWRAAEQVDYICSKKLHDPAVTVKPGALSNFWLEIKGGPRVKVQPVRQN